MERESTVNYIKAIAEVKSISVAAKNLGISQPALSSYLKKHEQELRVTLFDRSKQPLELTEAGKAYLRYLDKATILQRELTQNLADIVELNTGELTVGGASFINVAYLPKAVAAFAKKYPNINIEIIDGKVPELITAAQNGTLDLFITPFADETDRFTYEEFIDEKIYLAVPADWEINQKLQTAKPPKQSMTLSPTNITKEQFKSLCDNTFIVLKKDQHIGQIMEALFDMYNCRPKHIITAEQTMTTLALTQAGVGVSLITESIINNPTLSNLPQLYMIDSSIGKRKIFIAYPKNKYLSRAAKEFIQTIRSENVLPINR